MIPASGIARQFRRTFLSCLRQPRTIIHAGLFFCMMMVFFPLTLPASQPLLRTFAPGLLWLATLLAMLLASTNLFQQDYEDGLIEQWLVSGYPLALIVAVKLIMQWFFLILPIVLFLPLAAMLFGFGRSETGILAAGLFAGTPVILCLCALSSAFSTGLAGKGVLMPLILLPLAVPVLIFGSGTLEAVQAGNSLAAHLAMLAGLSLLAMGLLPVAIATVIRTGLAV